ncbi:MAG: hypothetical protein NTY66_02765 [Candidatus Vogelbacteria bacterium]|nr:hypothetical protein [Candidatus Vogelbacteria bacterium]
MKYSFSIIFASLSIITAGWAFGYTASSTHYILQSDSLNFGGGYSTSSDYSLQDTLGEIASGILTSSSSIMSGGYQAMPLNTYIAVASPADVALTPTISGVGGGISNGSSTWVVQTDNPAGYELSARASTSPAMKQGGSSFADYLPSYAEPDYAWNTPATESRFGYTPEGDDIPATFKDNGISCGTGSLDTSASCWQGFSLTDRVVARGSSPNYPSWATTTVRFRAEIGSQKPQQSGTYTATIIVTAVTL